MSDDRDLAFDIDALFEHMTDELGFGPDDELEWAFIVRSSDYQALEDAAHEFEDEFAIHLFEEVDEMDDDGNTTPGDPLMCVICVDALSAEQVKEIASRVDAVAAKRGLDYEGVQCAEPLGEDDTHDWFPTQEAAWRMQQLTEGGLQPDAPLPWTLLVVAPGPEAADKIAAELAAAGYDDYDQFDERDEEGDCGVCLFVAGKNNEAALEAALAKVSQTAAPHDGELIAVQFYNREEFYLVFGAGDEE